MRRSVHSPLRVSAVFPSVGTLAFCLACLYTAPLSRLFLSFCLSVSLCGPLSPLDSRSPSVSLSLSLSFCDQVLDFDRPVQEADRVWRSLGADGDGAVDLEDEERDDDGPNRWATDAGWAVEDVDR